MRLPTLILMTACAAHAGMLSYNLRGSGLVPVPAGFTIDVLIDIHTLVDFSGHLPDQLDFQAIMPLTNTIFNNLSITLVTSSGAKFVIPLSTQPGTVNGIPESFLMGSLGYGYEPRIPNAAWGNTTQAHLILLNTGTPITFASPIDNSPSPITFSLRYCSPNGTTYGAGAITRSALVYDVLDSPPIIYATTPEPSALAMMIGGIATIIAARLKRRLCLRRGGLART